MEASWATSVDMQVASAPAPQVGENGFSDRNQTLSVGVSLLCYLASELTRTVGKVDVGFATLIIKVGKFSLCPL